MSDKLLTDEMLAEALSVSRNTVRNWLSKGTIAAAIHEPGILRFDLDAVKRALAKRAAKRKPARQSVSADNPNQMVPTL